MQTGSLPVSAPSVAKFICMSQPNGLEYHSSVRVSISKAFSVSYGEAQKSHLPKLKKNDQDEEMTALYLLLFS